MILIIEGEESEQLLSLLSAAVRRGELGIRSLTIEAPEMAPPKPQEAPPKAIDEEARLKSLIQRLPAGRARRANAGHVNILAGTAKVVMDALREGPRRRVELVSRLTAGGYKAGSINGLLDRLIKAGLVGKAMGADGFTVYRVVDQARRAG